MIEVRNYGLLGILPFMFGVNLIASHIMPSARIQQLYIYYADIYDDRQRLWEEPDKQNILHTQALRCLMDSYHGEKKASLEEMHQVLESRFATEISFELSVTAT